MKAKDYLEKLFMLRNKIFNKALALEEWETAMGYQSPRFDGDGIRASAMPNKMDVMTNRRMELSCELEALNEEYDAYKKEVMQCLDDFGNKYPLEATILMAKYVNQKTYEEISKTVNYSHRWVRNLNKRALALFDEYLKERYD